MKKTTAISILKAQEACGRNIVRTEDKMGAIFTVALPECPRAQVIAVKDGEYVLEETSEGKINLRTWTMTEKNQAAFHYLYNENEKPVPTASFENGEFICHGLKIDTGSIPITGVLGCLPGYVVLTATSYEEENRDTLWSYDPQIDEFRIIDSEMTHTQFFADEVNGNLLVTGVSTNVLTESDEDGNTKAIECIENPEIFILRASRDTSMGVWIERFGELALDRPFYPKSVGALVHNGMIYVSYTYDEIMDWEDKEIKKIPTRTVVVNAQAVEPLLGCEGEGRYSVNGPSGRAPVISLSNGNSMAILYKGTVTVIPNDEAHTLDGYVNFAGYSQRRNEDTGRIIHTYTYANDNLDTITFDVEHTDRGQVVTFR